MQLFVDTAGWYALYDQRADQYEPARVLFDGLVNRRVTLFVTDYVIDETLTLISGRLGHASAVACGEWLLRSPLVKVVRVEPGQWDQAWAMFRRYTDKDFSFTDCTSFVVMQQHKLVDAFTFDHHFEQMGFRMWPA
jgi:predicted nucleic acid-binding protein